MLKHNKSGAAPSSRRGYHRSWLFRKRRQIASEPGVWQSIFLAALTAQVGPPRGLHMTLRGVFRTGDGLRLGVR